MLYYTDFNYASQKLPSCTLSGQRYSLVCLKVKLFPLILRYRQTDNWNVSIMLLWHYVGGFVIVITQRVHGKYWQSSCMRSWTQFNILYDYLYFSAKVWVTLICPKFCKFNSCVERCVQIQLIVWLIVGVARWTRWWSEIAAVHFLYLLLTKVFVIPFPVFVSLNCYYEYNHTNQTNNTCKE